MKEKILIEIYNYLFPILFNDREYDLIKTLKESSYSEANNQYMTKSIFLVIKCENLRDAYCAHKKYSQQLKSADAIYKFENKKIYLIEFKSGAVKGKNILKKGESVFNILEDLKFFDDKKYLSYIVVYNPKDIPIESSELEDITYIIIDFSIDTQENYKDYKNKELHDISSLEEKFFHEAYFCTKDDFNKYIVKEFEEEEK
ncbi:hypothetical protein [Brachyspira hyodysenteriae]|uniref:hypothetical protein n=1 Tax=Brachyspira hyodysenteriae TaxID=159 RepID=UPI00063DD029|nr:hypothetical protein [Brachyspira hyodysenteriae]KLI43012.1 hypothetical protein SZ53_05180 [Brachyspira hyodysenteriae]KLI46214.1 hypothetical protein SZ40_05505 [Brachyspira hyodysenteriae]KLI54740.1 hypothetical protein SZ45_11700 [Brachyspira hyodysenteriae]